jgi:hypothetical protein
MKRGEFMEKTSYEKEIIEKDKIIKEMQQIANELNYVLADYTSLINRNIEELYQELEDLKQMELNQDLEDDLEL